MHVFTVLTATNFILLSLLSSVASPSTVSASDDESHQTMFDAYILHQGLGCFTCRDPL